MVHDLWAGRRGETCRATPSQREIHSDKNVGPALSTPSDHFHFHGITIASSVFKMS